MSSVAFIWERPRVAVRDINNARGTASLITMSTGLRAAHSKWRTGLPSTGEEGDRLQKCPLDRNLCSERVWCVIAKCKHVNKANKIRVQWFHAY